MISSVVVSYRVRPKAVAEHLRLIEAVFEQLRAEQPDNIEYKVVRLADGVSFVHVPSADTPAGQAALRLPVMPADPPHQADANGRRSLAPGMQAARQVAVGRPGATAP